MINLLNASEMTRPHSFRHTDVRPAFFRLAAAWRERSNAPRLAGYLEAHGVNARIERAPVTLVYRQAAFLAMYEQHMKPDTSCPSAERAESETFVVLRSCPDRTCR